MNKIPPVRSAIGRASPSLALVKYWGKSDTAINLPATPSLAITLDKLCSETRVIAIHRQAGKSLPPDLVILDGQIQPSGRFAAYFEGLRGHLGVNLSFWAESTNNFPTAAGLASSSSGFAALTLTAAAAAGHPDCPLESLSGLARLGSGSAARSLFGGFTLLPAAAESATILHDHLFWPELRLVIVRIDEAKKDISSRQAMEQTRLTSPYYASWLADAPAVCAEAQTALAERDLDRLGSAMRRSYLRMFSTMFSADPPIIYWKADSLAVIRLCDELRTQGIPAWETMDAGPQVKILCTARNLAAITAALKDNLRIDRIMVDQVGPGPAILDQPQLLGPIHPLLQAAALERGIDLSPAGHSA